MIKVGDKVYRNIQEQVEKNKEDIEELKESGDTSYIAGNGIDITENVISVDTDTVAMKTDIPTYTGGTGIDITNNVVAVDNKVALKIDLPASVSGTNDGTNWTSLTVGNDTYGIPSGGGGAQLYQHNVVYKALNSNSKIVTYFTAQFVSTSPTAITTKARLIAYLDGAGFSSDSSGIDQPYLPVQGKSMINPGSTVPGNVYGIYYQTEDEEILLISDSGDFVTDYINVSAGQDSYNTVSIRDKVITL